MVTEKLLLTRICYLVIFLALSTYYIYVYHLLIEFPNIFTNGPISTTFTFNRINNYITNYRNFSSNKNRTHYFISDEFKLSNKSLPVIVRPIGGIGNQLFQYSTAYAVAKKRNSDLYICADEKSLKVSNTKTSQIFKAFNSFDRSYSLDIFNVPQDKLLFIPPGERVCRYNDLPGNFTKKDVSFFTEVNVINDTIPRDKVVQLAGYAESEIFFEDYKKELKELLHIKMDHIPVELNIILDKMNKSESVAVHVRRGDFSSNPNDNRTLPVRYYVRALKLMTEKLSTKNITGDKGKIQFFVFSDDIKNVRKEFLELFKNENYQMEFLSNQHFSRIVDFYLMSHCKHNVVANSTFSWWAAYLNRYANKLVVAPLPKFIRSWLKNYPEGEARNLANKIYRGEWGYPKNWITINPFQHEGLL